MVARLYMLWVLPIYQQECAPKDVHCTSIPIWEANILNFHNHVLLGSLPSFFHESTATDGMKKSSLFVPFCSPKKTTETETINTMYQCPKDPRKPSEDSHNPMMRVWFFNPQTSSCHNGVGSLGMYFTNSNNCLWPTTNRLRPVYVPTVSPTEKTPWEATAHRKVSQVCPSYVWNTLDILND